MTGFENTTIPSIGWSGVPLKHVAWINPEVLGEDTEPGYELEYVDIGSVTLEDGIRETSTVKFSEAPSRARRLIRHGDILVSTVRTYLRAIAPVVHPPANMIASTGFAVIRSRGVVDPAFLSWALRGSSFVDSVVAQSVGVSYPAIAPSVLGCIPIQFPDVEQQRSIADFLDRETARIDALIAKQTEFLTLLDEHRRALVTDAVTKGLDPSVSMKETGIAELGSVPAAWTVTRLKAVLTGIEQGWSPQCENRAAEDNEWGVLKVGCVNGDLFNPFENKALPEDLQPVPELEIRAGDVLMSRANTVELVGSVSLVEDVRQRLMLCDKLYRLKFDTRRVDPRYAVHCLTSSIGRAPLEAGATGASPSMKNISQDSVKSVWIPLPPIEQQREIAEHIRQRQNADEHIRATGRRMIDTLGERRSALITAAVTGQIDVTGSVPVRVAA